MAKLRLIYNQLGALNSEWMAPRFGRWFDIVPYEPGTTYDARDLTWSQFGETWAQELDQRRVIENLWEHSPGQTSRWENGAMLITAPDWMWINESLWWKHLKYDQYQAQPGGDCFMFMPMNRSAQHRDWLFDRVQPWLADSVYSYCERGIFLADDMPYNYLWGDWQRWVNIDWYNRTQFSLVTETMLYRSQDRVVVSEKTYKPLAYGHALVVYGTHSTLKSLRDQGFETFDHVIDESYDSNRIISQRKDAVVNLLSMLYSEWKQEKTLFSDSESLRKKQHNRQRFFDTAEIEKRFYNQIIIPLLEYAET